MRAIQSPESNPTPMRKLSEKVAVISLIKPQVATSTVTGTGVDCKAYEDDALAILDLGAAATHATSDTLNVVIQKCSAADGTGATTIGTFTELTGTSDNKIAAVGVLLNDSAKPYIRAVGTIVDGGGSDVSFAFGVTLVVRPTVEASGNTSATAA